MNVNVTEDSLAACHIQKQCQVSITEKRGRYILQMGTESQHISAELAAKIKEFMEEKKSETYSVLITLTMVVEGTELAKLMNREYEDCK